MKKTMLSTKQSYLVCFIGILAAFGIVMALCESGLADSYIKGIMMTACIAIIMTTSLNLTIGVLGQLTLGCCGFEAIGAYVAALTSKYMVAAGIAIDPTARFLLTTLIGGVVACVFGILIGIPALRLHGDYLAIITLGFAEIIRVVMLNIDSVVGFELTGGAKGLTGIPSYTNFLNTFVIVAIVLFLIHTMMKSRHGRAILAIRDNEIAAEASGVNTTYYKTLAFVVSAFFAGIAGGLYAGCVGVMMPAKFGFMKSIEILVMVVLGGMGSMLGSVLSATVLTILPEALRAFADYRMIVYSVVLILVMIFRPQGLLGTYDFSMSRVIERIMNKDFPWKKNAKEVEADA